MDIIEGIRTRRSIRKFKNTPVDQSILSSILDAARWAPSWANTQCCRFIAVTETQVKEKLAETLLPRNPAINSIKQAPILIVACAEQNKSGFYDGVAETDKGDWFMYDVGVAMQNLMLAAHSFGLGTVHVGLFDAGKAANILKVPPGFCVVSMTPIGYPDQQPAPRPRKELSEIVFRDRFGQV